MSVLWSFQEACSDGNDFVVLTDNRMCPCVFLGFKHFSVLISNTMNIDTCDPHEQGPFEVLNNFEV